MKTTTRIPKILAICPYRHLGVLLQSELARHKVEVETCTSPGEGQVRAQRGGFAAVLVDDRPSQKKSIEAIGALKRATPATMAIVWLCGDVTRSTALEALKAGAHGIAVRPTSVPDLLAVLLKALDRVKSEARAGVEPAVAVPATAASEEDLWKVLDRVDSLRASPHVVEQVLSLTGSDDSSAEDLARVVESDQNTTAVVLKRANSALYAAGKKISRPKEAITRLGFRNVRALVLALQVIQNFASDQRSLGFEPTEYWKFCTARAILARNLARLANSEREDDVYLAALLQDIGKIILDEHATEPFAQAVSIATDQQIPLAQAERHVLGTDHAAVGSRILERWNFPPELSLIAGIRSLQDLGDVPFAIRPVAAAIAIAESICRALGWGDAIDRHIEPLPHDHFAQVGLPSALPESFFLDSVTEINEMWSSLGRDADRAHVPGKRAEGIALFHEEGSPPVSPIRLALQGSGVQVETLGRLEDLRTRTISTVAVLCASDLDGLRRIERTCPGIGEKPVLLLAPRDSFPADDSVKARVGIPSGRCAYLGLPVDARELLSKLVEF